MAKMMYHYTPPSEVLRKSYNGRLELIGKTSISMTKDACVVHASVNTLKGEVFGEGTSKRDPQDPYIEEVGYKLAMSRAYASIAKQLQREANAITSQIDNDRKQRSKSNDATFEVSISVTPAETQCVAITKKGTRCTFSVNPADVWYGPYCGHHNK